MISLNRKEINKYVILSFVAVLSLGCFQQRKPTKLKLDFNNSLILSSESHFKNMSQLTFSGENAEAYFSADGRKLIYQAHDGDSLCDQIYIMDIESKSIELVSTGAGFTTCSFFKYPNETAFIPKGAVHRIENAFNKPVQIVEVQTGSILKESDIVRYKDVYGRVN